MGGFFVGFLNKIVGSVGITQVATQALDRRECLASKRVESKSVAFLGGTRQLVELVHPNSVHLREPDGASRRPKVL